jgi:Xaa-Pro dipeptidase
MSEAGIDAALLVHHRDILYYAGTARPAVLLVSPRDTCLLVRRGLAYARREARVAHVEQMNGLSSVAESLAALGLAGGVLGTELDLIPTRLSQRLHAVCPAWSLADVSPLVLGQRAVKDEGEIAATRAAAGVADAGHAIVRQTAVPGMSELALVAAVEMAIRQAGHEGFQPLRHPGARGAGVLLASGENLSVRGGHGLIVTGMGLSPSMPYGASRRVLEPGDLVVVDIGSTYAGYTGDESRTFVIGRATDEQRALFAVAHAAEDVVLENLRPGALPADLYAEAEAMVARGASPYGCSLSAFAPGSLTLPGFVGHGIGLELDEPPVLWPRAQTPLQAGMVLAIEIEVSAPKAGMMVKLEDTVLVCPDGAGCSGPYELLTATPRELIECG